MLDEKTRWLLVLVAGAGGIYATFSDVSHFNPNPGGVALECIAIILLAVFA